MDMTDDQVATLVKKLDSLSNQRKPGTKKKGKNAKNSTNTPWDVISTSYSGPFYKCVLFNYIRQTINIPFALFFRCFTSGNRHSLIDAVERDLCVRLSSDPNFSNGPGSYPNAEAMVERASRNAIVN